MGLSSRLLPLATLSSSLSCFLVDLWGGSMIKLGGLGGGRQMNRVTVTFALCIGIVAILIVVIGQTEFLFLFLEVEVVIKAHIFIKVLLLV